MILTILLATIFGLVGGVIGAAVLEAYFQRRATDVVGDFDAPPATTGGKRRAG
jgi:hypothetical protein